MTFSQVIITMMRPLIGQPSLFNHHCNYHTITHSQTNAEKMAPHGKNILQHTRCTDPSLRNASVREIGNLKNLCSHTICFYHSYTRAYTLVQCKISSISCLLSFSLWVLYLTITCNDRDITIMITPFANAALSTHAHSCAERYTHTVHKQK